MSVRLKTVEEILQSPFLRTKDIERALGISSRQAATVFIAAKRHDNERGLVEISPRKVRRESVEKVTGVSFSRIAKEKAAARSAADGAGTPSK